MIGRSLRVLIDEMVIADVDRPLLGENLVGLRVVRKSRLLGFRWEGEEALVLVERSLQDVLRLFIVVNEIIDVIVFEFLFPVLSKSLPDLGW